MTRSRLNASAVHGHGCPRQVTPHRKLAIDPTSRAGEMKSMASSCACSCTARMRGAHARSGDWAKQSVLSSVRNSHCCACPAPPAGRASESAYTVHFVAAGLTVRPAIIV